MKVLLFFVLIAKGGAKIIVPLLLFILFLVYFFSMYIVFLETPFSGGGEGGFYKYSSYSPIPPTDTHIQQVTFIYSLAPCNRFYIIVNNRMLSLQG